MSTTTSLAQQLHDFAAVLKRTMPHDVDEPAMAALRELLEEIEALQRSVMIGTQP